MYPSTFHFLLTASNGNPRLPDSLHYLDPSGRLNAYQRVLKLLSAVFLTSFYLLFTMYIYHLIGQFVFQAILEVGEVLKFYDSDKRFPAWGFGARPIDGPVSHCFNLNGSNNHSEVKYFEIRSQMFVLYLQCLCFKRMPLFQVDGIQGIMTAYTSALYNVSLAGPTLFGPVISNAALIASQSPANGGKKYFVLLIITVRMTLKFWLVLSGRHAMLIAHQFHNLAPFSFLNILFRNCLFQFCNVMSFRFDVEFNYLFFRMDLAYSQKNKTFVFNIFNFFFALKRDCLRMEL
jgi:hypothetical protein